MLNNAPPAIKRSSSGALSNSYAHDRHLPILIFFGRDGAIAIADHRRLRAELVDVSSCSP
jgi:hypothetical protein